MEITIKNLRTFYTPDGGGFNCTVYVDGKRFCEAHEAGRGGCIEYHEIGKTTGEELLAFWKTPQIDIKVCEAVDEYELQKNIKKYKNKMKKEVCWVDSSCGRGQYITVKIKDPSLYESTKQIWQIKYPDAVFLDNEKDIKRFLECEITFKEGVEK